MRLVDRVVSFVRELVRELPKNIPHRIFLVIGKVFGFEQLITGANEVRDDMAKFRHKLFSYLFRQ